MSSLVPRFYSPAQVCDMVPGMTVTTLNQRRFKSLPPAWIKPSPRVVVYSEAAVLAWLTDSEVMPMAA